MITPEVVVTESTSRKVAGGPASGNRRRPDPSTSGWIVSRYSSIRPARIRDCTRAPLPRTVDVDAVLEVIFGALFHRLLLRSGPLDAAYANFVVDTVFAGISAVRRA